MSRLKILTIILILLLGAFEVYGQDENDTGGAIQAAWNQEIFVLVNNGESGVDVSNLLLLGEQGEVAPTDWQLRTPSSGELFSLTDIQPGACLAAYQTAERPDLPQGVTCEMIVGEFKVVSDNDLFWNDTQEAFIPFVDNIEQEACATDETPCAIAVPFAVQEEPETTQIRAVWTLDIFVLINTGSRGADISSLRLVSQAGEISPDEWVLDFSQEASDFYTLDDMRPGSCLVANIGSILPEVPSSIRCSRIMGRYSIESFEDVIWGIPQGGFTPYIGDNMGEPCSIQKTSCDISVINADANPENTATETVESGAQATEAASGSTVRAIWNKDIFVLINVGETGADISNLSFTSELGEILPDNWLLNAPEAGSTPYSVQDMRPGSCLLAFLDTSRVEIPSDVDCARIMGEYAILLPGNLVWSVSQGGFTPYIGNTAGDSCSIDRSICDIQVPSSGN